FLNPNPLNLMPMGVRCATPGCEIQRLRRSNPSPRNVMPRTIVVLAALLLAARAPAADEPKQLTLRWLGQSFFVLTTSAGTRVAFDPHAIPELGRPTTEADLVLISHPHPDHVRVESITNRAKAKIIEGIKVQPPAAEGG